MPTLAASSRSTAAASASCCAEHGDPFGARRGAASLNLRLRLSASLAAMNVPEELRYTKDHEWAKVEGDRIRIGITDYAQDALGDVVYVQLPDLGAEVAAGASFSEVESTKSVSEIYAPIAGTVVEVNQDLVDTPQRLNDDPYGEGWLCVIEMSDASGLDELLDAAAYRALIDG